MKYTFKKIYLILLTITIFLFSSAVFAKDSKVDYSSDNIANYFFGIISANQNYTNQAFKHLNKVKSLKNNHTNYNIQFIRALILLDKFEQAFNFSKEIWSKDEYLFEVDLLLGLESFVKGDYLTAKKYFERINRISPYNLYFSDFFGNILLAWNSASNSNIKDSFKFFEKIPDRYENLKQIQGIFLQCHFDNPLTQSAFEQLVSKESLGFSRYNYFLANYLLFKNKKEEARKIINLSAKTHSSNILLRQTANFFSTGDINKIKKLFNCKNPRDVLAEVFYIIANLYSTEKDYQSSNFYLKISLFLNNKFTPNKTLIGENFFYQKKYEESEEVYNSIKSIGPVYSWYASRSLAAILLETKGKKYATSNLENEFNLLSNPNFKHYYDLANFFKDNNYHEKSIKYYSLALKNIQQDHPLVSKIYDRRGTSYERFGDWERAEKDLTQSLRLSPDQPHVLNYLAYSWVEKGININKALEMLEKANKLRENDGYIIDSLGWAHYVNKNYSDAKKFLQMAVEIMPEDPIINDHYADVLWMLNKNIQARYFWNHVLSLETAEEELKDSINQKLIFGIREKL